MFLKLLYMHAFPMGGESMRGRLMQALDWTVQAAT